MSKLIFTGICACVISVVLAANLLGRPCTPQEQQIHNFIRTQIKGGECFVPDPHPLPYGIFYPKGDRMAEHYVYFINAGGKPIIASLYEMLPEGDSETPYQPAPGEEEGWQPTWTLQPRQYTVDSSNEYEFSIGAAKKEVKISAKVMKKSGPTLYSFYKIYPKNGTVVVEEISEKAAINILKNMRYTR